MFKLIKIENGRQNVPEPDYLDVTENEAVAIGEALVLANGKLTKCPETTVPKYIAMGEVSKASEKRTVAVCRIESNHLYEVPVSDAPSVLKIGDKVTLYAGDAESGEIGADRVTATTEGGVAEIVALNGAAVAGDKITVRF